LGASVDFSKMPYRDRPTKLNANGNTPYLSEEIVTPPFRGETLRLKRGVHLHWAMPDALTQGVNRRRLSGGEHLEFPTLPDRWLVTRRARQTGDVQRQWIVTSDHLAPERGLEEDQLDAVTFPLPPVKDSTHGQPYRYLGQVWPVANGIAWPKLLREGTYLNSVASLYENGSENQQMVAGGLTAMGYGDPVFSAFYPNCRNIYGVWDPDTTTDDAFAKVVYDVVGWHDLPAERDSLRDSSDAEPTALGEAIEAQKAREIKEHLASGHALPDVTGPEYWARALGHHLGWGVEDEGAEHPKRTLYHGRVRAANDAQFDHDPAKSTGPVSLAIGNTASEALSVAVGTTLGQGDAAKARLIEEQLEALDLSDHLHHRANDLGPKFNEARHNKGFTAERGGTLFTLKLEPKPTSTQKADPSAAPTAAAHLPDYLMERLNTLNVAQQDFEHSKDAISAMRAQIYRDWTLYMDCLRPAGGIDEHRPDPIEMIRFIEATGFAPLRAALAAAGPEPNFMMDDEDAISDETSAPSKGRIVNATVSPSTSDSALSAILVQDINSVLFDIGLINDVLETVARLDEAMAREKETPTQDHKLSEYKDIQIPLGDVNVTSLEFSPDDKTLLVGHIDGFDIYDLWTKEKTASYGSSQYNHRIARFSPDGKTVLWTARDDDEGAIMSLFDVETGTNIINFEYYAENPNFGNIHAAHFVSEGSSILTGNDSGALQMWDAVGGQETSVKQLFKDEVRSWEFLLKLQSIKMATHKARFVAQSYSGKGIIVDFDTNQEPTKIDTNIKGLFFEIEIESVDISPAGDLVLAVLKDGGLIIADADTGARLHFLEMDSGVQAKFAPDGKTLAVLDHGGIVFFSTLTGEIISQFETDVYRSQDLIYSPDGAILAVFGKTGTIEWWDLHTFKRIGSLENNTSRPTLVFDRTGARMAIASREDGHEATLSLVHVGQGDNSLLDKEAAASRFSKRFGLKAQDIKEVEKIRKDVLFDLSCVSSSEELLEAANMHSPWVYFPDVSFDTPACSANFVLRRIEGPRSYRPSDPVVLIQGEDVAPTNRHGADGRHRKDGLLTCKIQEFEHIPSTRDWKSSGLPSGLTEILNYLNAAPELADDVITDGPGLKVWKHQPWHPFAMEWQVEVAPDSAGGNREQAHHGFATDFVERHHGLAELDVELKRKLGPEAPTKTEMGIYNGHVILVDHASKILENKLDAFLAQADELDVQAHAVDSETSDQISDAHTANLATLHAVRDKMATLPAALTQSLDGLHEAFLQRHQILQLPIADPLGFPDLAHFTDAVRKVTVGLHGNAPLRTHDYMPIRSGTMSLEKLRLVDSFGRTRDLRGDTTQAPLAVAQTLTDASHPEMIALPPRLVQPARLNFRWLAAGGLNETTDQDVTAQETNTHPGSTPVCGWLMPNWLDGSLGVHDADGAALGFVVRHGDVVVWQSAPGDAKPIHQIDRPHPRLNRHLRVLLVALIDELGQKDPTFFPAFLDAISNSLESIAPESFSNHRSLALLMGRPVAVVRASVDLLLKNPATPSQSVGSVIADMHKAIDPDKSIDDPLSNRTLFTTQGAEAAMLLDAMRTNDIASIRAAYGRRLMAFPKQDIDVSLAATEDQNIWKLRVSDQNFTILTARETVTITKDSRRSTDGFTQVRFPIRIGEDQQLNDGLIGYFREDPNAEGYCFHKTTFYAPQSAQRIEISPSLNSANPQQISDKLNLGQLPNEVSQRLSLPNDTRVTINKPNHHWRLDTETQVFELTKVRDGFGLVELKQSTSPHLINHWKKPINLSLSVDDPPQVLTMLMDPQGSVHAVSGILPTKEISVPSEFYAEALRNIEVSFLTAPILTDSEKIELPLWDQDGLEWSWLTRDGDVWDSTDKIGSVHSRAEVSPRQRLVEGWLHLMREKE
jgi:WD40 repeat protein